MTGDREFTSRLRLWPVADDQLAIFAGSEQQLAVGRVNNGAGCAGMSFQLPRLSSQRNATSKNNSGNA